VLIHPGKYYTSRLSKVKDILLREMPTNDAKVREKDFACFVFFVGKLTLLYIKSKKGMVLLRYCAQ